MSLSKRIPETASSTTRSVVNTGNNLFVIQVTERRSAKENDMNQFGQGNHVTGATVSGTRENWDSRKEGKYDKKGSKWEEQGDRNSFDKERC